MYELTYIVSPNLSETDIAAFNEKVKDFIIKEEGQIKKEKIGKKDKLAYPIKKNDFGYYLTLEFNLKSDSIKELEKKIKSEKDVLRHIIIKRDEKSMPVKLPRVKPEKIQPEISGSVKEKEKPALSPKQEKVKLEELDKRLEEILKE